jgi:dipeptidyl aminopeptidase/acylaminoacyl peptidase
MRHALLALLLALVPGDARPGPSGARLLAIDTLVDIKHPSQAVWSPDSARVAFLWDRGGVQNVWVADATQGGLKGLTDFDTGTIDGLFWSSDGNYLSYEKAGDLSRISIAGSRSAAVWTTEAAESEITPSPDGKRLVLVRAGDLWLRDAATHRETRLTETPETETEPVWSPDGERIAFTILSWTAQEAAPDYVGAKLAFRRQSDYRSRVGVAPTRGGAWKPVAAGDGNDSAARWVDATRLSLQRESPDAKTREVLLADVASGAVRVLHRDVDPRFWSLTYLGAEPLPSPDGRWVAFLSDRDGWDHLYLAPTEGGAAVQVTRGRFEVASLAWSPDGRRIVFDANSEEQPGRRQLMYVEPGADPGRAEPVVLTSGPGTNTAASWSPDGRRLIYQHTDPRSPADLYVVDASPGAKPTRLTESLPASVDRGALVEPRLVRYPSKDGQAVPAYLFVPNGLDRARPHPAIVWVHGDGITQNFEGWHTRRDYAVYYSVHQYLVQRGYVVLAVDYRGSIGYGRDWRQGHYRDLGGRDYEDVAAGVDFLKSLGFVDAARVGIWGLSYGGFMTLQGLTVTPELFRCGIDVAGVQDWNDWYRDPGGPWVIGRMGRPEAERELYRRSSPIYSVDRIVRPLLVMHGTADVNVPFLESLRLVDAALKAGKDVDFVVYPGEYHYFHRAHVLRDAWSRVERFFDKHLRKPE